MRFIPIIFFLILFSSCGKKPETLYDEAKKAQEEKNFPVALERYNEIIEKNTGSALAESSLYRLALLYNNDLHDMEKSLRAYQRYYELFPESKGAPTAMFLSAFLLNNDLHKLDSAKILYETFIQKYPNHELVPSARFELETMGKDPGIVFKHDSTLNEQEKPMPAQGKPK